MKKQNVALRETGLILLGEIVVSLLICAVYLIIGHFSYKVVTGVCLGSAVIVLNFLFLSLSTNRSIDEFLRLRGTEEMDDEEAEAFAQKYQMQIQNKAKLSLIIRMITMVAALVVAFILKYFDVLATLIPLLMFRPIITVETLIRSRLGKGKNNEIIG